MAVMNRICAFAASLLLASTTALAADPPAKAEIEKTLQVMSGAALAGDTDAFMACLDQSNPFFKQEQTEGCAEAAKHHPKQVVFALAKKPAPEFGEDETHATVTIQYVSAE